MVAPSLRHRVDTTTAWVAKLVKFDAQTLQNSEISGTEYQQGTLFGYEVREYLLEKFGRKCVYCGAENVPLNIDHVVPKARGGSNRISNLVLSCVNCNQKKDSNLLGFSLKIDPEVLDRIKRGLKTPLRDAAAVNATRWTLFNSLKAFGFPSKRVRAH